MPFLCVILGLAWVTPGCVTGHAVEAARRYEHVVDFDFACRYQGRLYLRYTAGIETEFGEELDRRELVAAIGIDAFRAEARRSVDDYSVERVVVGPSLWERCRPVPLRNVAQRDSEVNPDFSEAEVWLVELDAANPGSFVALPTGAFSRRSTAPWVWLLMPVTVAFDVVLVPPLVLLAVPLFAFGD